MPDCLAETPYDTLSVVSDSLGEKFFVPEVSFSSDMELFDCPVVDTTNLSGVFGARAEYGSIQNIELQQGADFDLPFVATEFVVAVVLVCFYCYVVTTYSKIITAVLRVPFSSFTEKNLLTSTDLNVSRLMSYCTVMLFLGLSLTIADLGNTKGVEFPSFEKFDFLWAYGFVSVLFLYRFFFFHGARWYSRADDFFSRLRAKLRLTTAFLVIGVVPAVLFATFGKRVFGASEYFLYQLVILCGLFYVIRVALFFKAEKVSFLQYILYFCAVDLIPLSFLYALIHKF